MSNQYDRRTTSQSTTNQDNKVAGGANSVNVGADSKGNINVVTNDPTSILETVKQAFNFGGNVVRESVESVKQSFDASADFASSTQDEFTKQLSSQAEGNKKLIDKTLERLESQEEKDNKKVLLIAFAGLIGIGWVATKRK